MSDELGVNLAQLLLIAVFNTATAGLPDQDLNAKRQKMQTLGRLVVTCHRLQVPLALLKLDYVKDLNSRIDAELSQVLTKAQNFLLDACIRDRPAHGCDLRICWQNQVKRVKAQ